MDKKTNNVFRSMLTQVAGATSDTAFAALVTSYNLPVGLTLGGLKAILKGGTQALMQNCYDDIAARLLSSREVEKHSKVFETAERTFFELAYKDDVRSFEVSCDDSYFQYAYEVAEHLSIEAIRQSEEVKIDVLGRLYGRSFYYADIEWQDMHQIITMVGTLTLRQVILIRLICEGFEGYDKDFFISNPSVCVELHRLLDYGIWSTGGAAFGIDNSQPIQLSTLLPTEYAKKVSEVLMLEKLSCEDIKRVFDSLKLSKDGKELNVLTYEEYQSTNRWLEIGGGDYQVIDGGTAEEETSGTPKDYWK